MDEGSAWMEVLRPTGSHPLVILCHSQRFMGPLGPKETQASQQNFLGYVTTGSTIPRTLWVLRAGIVSDMKRVGLLRARL